MRLVTYCSESDVPHVGLMGVDDSITPIERVLGNGAPSSVLELLDCEPSVRAELVRRAGGREHGDPLPPGSYRLLAPIPRPRKNIFCVAMNYPGVAPPGLERANAPVYFSKPPTCVIGPEMPVIADPALTRALDWEVELAVVMERTARRVTSAVALEYVFGYSIIVDVSARDAVRGGQWFYGKAMDTFAPFGPAIVTRDELADPADLDIWLRKNGKLKQSSNTSNMIYSIAELIADLSRAITLEPGDIIATGTPAGSGVMQNPPEWLVPGDVVEAGIAGVGTLRNVVVSA